MDGKSISAVLIQSAKDMKADKITMRELEALAMPAVESLSPRQIKKIRMEANASQEVMACFLNVGVTTMQKWERGDSHPHGAALKLLNLAHRNGIQSII